MKISNEVLNVLEASEIKDGKLYLPGGQLERKLYVDVNKVLELLGGKWSRKDKAHTFDTDPSEAIDEAMLTGEVTDEKKEFQFFETPREVAERIVDLAEIREGQSVLEPSAGRGAIAVCVLEKHPSNQLTLVELNPKNKLCLHELTERTEIMDFMKYKTKHDRIVANPPFCKQQDVDHVIHMFELLNKDGVLVSIMSPSWQFRENKKSIYFREFLDNHDTEVIELEEGTFKKSGTMVRSCIVKIRK